MSIEDLWLGVGQERPFTTEASDFQFGRKRRALEAKFYASMEDKSMRAELRLRVVAWANSTRLTLTALVG